MFERYTESARRVVFWGRYQANTFGSHEITTEHLLLGLLREDSGLLDQIIPAAEPEAIRKQISAKIPGKEKVSTSIDLPLSVDAKMALSHAADEAERLRHRHIGTEHLLLGILQQEGCLAAQVLRENGFDLDTARTKLAGTPEIAKGVSYTSYATREHGVLLSAGDPLQLAIPEARSDAEVVLKVEGLTKVYTGVGESLEILRGIDLTIFRGETVAIMGQSGSGKSTLLHILGTIDRPTSGTVRLGGQNPFSLKPEDLARFRRRSVGFVFQFHNLLPEFTALENVLMPRLISGNHSDGRLGVELLELVGLGHRLKHRPGELSGGEQQRVAIARALVNNPLLILADEPTGALDNQTGELVFQLFQRIQREKNLTSILATHNANIANRCNRLLRLENGRLQETDQRHV